MTETIMWPEHLPALKLSVHLAQINAVDAMDACSVSKFPPIRSYTFTLSQYSDTSVLLPITPVVLSTDKKPITILNCLAVSTMLPRLDQNYKITVAAIAGWKNISGDEKEIIEFSLQFLQPAAMPNSGMSVRRMLKELRERPALDRFLAYYYFGTKSLSAQQIAHLLNHRVKKNQINNISANLPDTQTRRAKSSRIEQTQNAKSKNVEEKDYSDKEHHIALLNQKWNHIVVKEDKCLPSLYQIFACSGGDPAGSSIDKLIERFHNHLKKIRSDDDENLRDALIKFEDLVVKHDLLKYFIRTSLGLSDDGGQKQ